MGYELQDILKDPTWLFDLCLPVYRFDFRGNPRDLSSWELTAGFEQPRFYDLADKRPFADAMLGWNADGLFLQFDVREKSRLKSPGMIHYTLEFFIDTRHGPGVHRATAYCHRFVFICSTMPGGVPASDTMRRIHGELTYIQRAKESPPDVHPENLFAGIVALAGGGYSFRVFLSKDVLNGYDPEEISELGIQYGLNDTSRGFQTMARSSTGGKTDDPSLWCRGKLMGPPSVA